MRLFSFHRRVGALKYSVSKHLSKVSEEKGDIKPDGWFIFIILMTSAVFWKVLYSWWRWTKKQWEVLDIWKPTWKWRETRPPVGAHASLRPCWILVKRYTVHRQLLDKRCSFYFFIFVQSEVWPWWLMGNLDPWWEGRISLLWKKRVRRHCSTQVSRAAFCVPRPQPASSCYGIRGFSEK